MSKSADPFDFDSLVEAYIPVAVAGKKYILREATEDSACRYRNKAIACTKLGSDGKPSSVENLADIEPLLVSLCLYDEHGKNVPESIIRKWSSRIVKKIFEKAKSISELDEVEEDIAALEKRLEEAKAKADPAKNEQSGTTDISV